MPVELFAAASAALGRTTDEARPARRRRARRPDGRARRPRRGEPDPANASAVLARCTYLVEGVATSDRDAPSPRAARWTCCRRSRGLIGRPAGRRRTASAGGWGMSDGSDPTRVRDQPAIRSGRRRAWLVPAGLLAGITIALLAASLSFATTVPVVGIAATAVLYAAMVVVAIAVRPVRARNAALAWLMILIAVVALGSLLLLLGVARAAAS
ncbi:hypothetical protein [Clavibacter tessellarius]|uniref:hypothetical protein n=2 Tax=Microbacteriaceae TaxID=85023 RepID=UPI003250487E